MNKASTMCFAALVLVLACACAWATMVVPASHFTVVIVPDTQYLTAGVPSVLSEQMHWIAQRSAVDDGVAAVLHTGDVTQDDNRVEWTRFVGTLRASVAQKRLPLAVTTGNHDSEGAFHRYMGRCGGGGAASALAGAWSNVRCGPDGVSALYTLGHAGGTAATLRVLVVGWHAKEETLAWARARWAALAGLVSAQDVTIMLHHAGVRPLTVAHEVTPGAVPLAVIGTAPPRPSALTVLVGGHETHAFPAVNVSDGTNLLLVGVNYQQWSATGRTASAGGAVHVLRFSPARATVHARTFSPALCLHMRGPAQEYVYDAAAHTVAAVTSPSFHGDTTRGRSDLAACALGLPSAGWWALSFTGTLLLAAAVGGVACVCGCVLAGRK